MRLRIHTAALAAVGGLWLACLAPAAQAATPTLGAVSATDLQGVSALLLGTVNPEGLDTTYRFEYVDQTAFMASGFATATATPATPAGSGSTDLPARAAISGLSPDTTYDYRLLASNSSGTTTGAPDTFTTTHGFGFLAGPNGFAAAAITGTGDPATVAGSHPFQLNLGLGFNLGGEFEGQPTTDFPDGDLRDLHIQLPPGLVLNPSSVETCTEAQFHTPRPTPTTVPPGFTESPFVPSLSGESCPDRSQVGTVVVGTSLDTAHSQLPDGSVRRFGVFNLDPPPGVLGQVGFSPFGVPIVFNLALRPDANHGYVVVLEAQDVPQILSIHDFNLRLWGIPWDGSGKGVRDALPGTSHDTERGDCLYQVDEDSSGNPLPPAECPTEPPPPCNPAEEECPPAPEFPPLAYLTLPTSCTGPLAFSASADAWQQPAQVTAEALNRDSAGNPVDQEGCQSTPFAPSTGGFLTNTAASSASGFNFRLSNDNSGLTNPTQQLPSQTRTAVVTLPPGVTLNPSLGVGLDSCTPTQYAQETASSSQGAGCPNGSKIGDFSVRTPLFNGSIDGAVYLAQPDDPATPTPGAENPFDTLLAIYLVAKSPERGVLVKLAGKLVPDPGTGQLTATFDGLPQLPYTELDLTFKTGQRAPLVTPSSCGPATTQIDLSPWSGGADLIASSPSSIDRGIGAGPCPSAGVPPFNPEVTAGGVNANVGSYTPYYVHLSRTDDQQEITSYSLVLPKGITGKLAGIPFCPEADIEAARHNSGAAEAANPSCPQASLVGHTLTGYGVGNALTYASGRIYLAGPYHGAPLSLVTINSATVGPFDLGTIVIRSAFQVDEHTAQLQIDSHASDPIPHIIDGIPLHLRDIRVYVDRPNFTHNPSSCEPSQLDSTLTGSGANFADPSDDSTATVSEHFQLLNCLTLGFKPKLGLELRGGTKRGAYPELRATFKTRGPQDSNLKDMAVVIPHQMFVAQNHIRGICTRPQFDAEQCPADSVYGRASASTLLFDQPLTGNVYLLSAPGRHLPDLVADLHSGAIRIVVEGSIGPSRSGGVLTQFTNLPDAPIDRFSMTLDGGKQGLLVNSQNICTAPPLVSVKALAQNNIGAVFTAELRGQCKHKHKRHHRRQPNKYKRHRGHKVK